VYFRSINQGIASSIFRIPNLSLTSLLMFLKV
jgi:hypothetical protein